MDQDTNSNHSIGARDGEALPPSCRQRSREDLRRVQMIFQMADTALNPKVRVRDALGRPLTRLMGLRGRAREERLHQLMREIDMDPAVHLDRYPGELSGGQKQRFAIAATLVNDPEVVFLDEPTAGLDPQARRNLWDFVQSINSQGRTIVLTTHYMEEAEFLCDRVAIMDQGRIVTLDTPTNLVRSLPVPYEVRASTLNEFSSNGLADLDCVTEVLDDQNQGFRLRSSDAASTMPALMDWVAKNDIKLTHLEVTPANLEDVFLSLTGRALRD